MSSTRKTALKLPRLRTKDELLKTSPELFGKLLLGDDISSARSTVLPAATKHAAGNAAGAAGAPATRTQSAAIKPASSAARTTSMRQQGGSTGVPRSASAGRHGTMGMFDTPRGFGEEGMTEEQELAIELDSVKRERERLLEAIAHVKGSAGTAGGEAQQADIQQLLRELEAKKAKLNELKGEAQRLSNHLQRLRDDNTDALRLTPGQMAEENAYIQSLTDEGRQVEEDLQEAEAKNRLYTLLLERTRREHMAIDQQVRDKQESKRNCSEDLHNLGEHFNTTRAAKELAERDLAKVKRQVEEARQDWIRKNKERRNEVRELKKRQARDREKEVRKRERRQEKERQEREASAKIRMEQEAYELQVAALAPKIEALEASWNRLRAISGGETPEGVVRYWDGLKAKESSMMDLVRLAERREAACKHEMAALMARRSEMLETRAAEAAAAAAAREAAMAAAAEAEAGAEAGGEAGGEWGLADGEEAETPRTRVVSADKRIAVAETSFLKLRRICIAAEQGLLTLLRKSMVSLGEGPLPSQVAASGGAPAAAPGALGAQQQPGAGDPGSISHGGSSASGAQLRMGSAASGGSSARERGLVGSGAAVGSGSRKGQQGANALAAKSARLKSMGSRVGGADAAATAAAAAHLSDVPETGLSDSGAVSAASTQRGTALDHGAAGHGAGDDSSAAFFPGLVDLVQGLTELLERILAAGADLDVSALRSTMAAAAALAQSASALTGSGTGTVEPTPRSEVAGAEAAAGAPPAQPAVTAVAPAVPSEAEGEKKAEGVEEPPVEGQESKKEHEEEGEAAEQAGGEEEEVRAEKEGGQEGEEEKASQEAGEGAVAAASAAEVGEAPAAGGEKPAKASAVEVPTLPLGAAQAQGGEAAPRAAAAEGAEAAAGAAGALADGSAPSTGARERGAILQSEKALMKGLERRTWTGAPWLDAVSVNPLDMNLVPSMKRKKGSKKGAGGPDLSRILGCQPPVDADAESESEPEEEEEEGAADGVLDREWIKMRAAKMLARHVARQQQAAMVAAGGR